jgi:hemolysin D
MNLKLRGQAFADLMRRYGAVFGHAWSQRKTMEPPQRLPHELQFLPAALALQETPPSPAPRVMLWAIVSFATIAVIWASVGRIDIVATAQGKVIPDAGSKVIQPIETAAVQAIHVREGQTVRAGDPLIDLDATVAMADRTRISTQIVDLQLLVGRARAMLAALDGGKVPVLSAAVTGKSLTGDKLVEARQLLASQYQEYQARQSSIDAESARMDAEMQSTLEAVRKLEMTLPIAERRAQDFKNLVDENFASHHGYMEREEQRIEKTADLATLRSRLREIEAGRRHVQNQKTELFTQTRRVNLDAISDGTQRIAALEQELAKADTHDRLMRLTAPVDGTVQQLAMRTIGGVVTPAQQLLVVVPRSDALEVEAFIENKDIGFVRPGQDVTVKVETFQYTRYGTISGRITSVSHDAINDEKRGLIYSIRVMLDQKSLDVDGVEVSLTPGMAVRVETRLGTRRVIEYFLTPFLRATSESLRER